MSAPHTAGRPLRVLIVDDERLPRQRLLRLLEEVPNTECVGECANGRSTVEAIESLLPDLVLLDVRMPGMGGLEVARALTGHVPFVIFVTAFDEYALSAFEVHAIDYLLKPVERERFVAAVERARVLVSSTSAAQRHERLLALLKDDAQAGEGADARSSLGDPTAPPVAGDSAVFPRRFLVKGDGRCTSWPWMTSTGSRRTETTCACTSARACTSSARRSATSSESSTRRGSRAYTAHRS